MKRPKPPAPLSKLAAAKWKQLVADLSHKSEWSAEDRHALFILATALAQYEDAESKLFDAETGELLSVVLSASGNPQKNPYILVQNQAWDRAQKLLHAFGLTPAGRAALKLDSQPKINLADLIPK